jgi:antitoxin YefM
MERIISYSRLRNELSRVLDQVNDDHAPAIITRRNGKPAVLMSLEDYASHKETEYLLSSPANAKQLAESIAQLNAGKGIVRKLIPVGRRAPRRRKS